jgi:rhamnosyltransferase
VDNGSSDDEISALRLASQCSGFQLIENGENLGIAEALNQGVRWAKTKNYLWVILFDQDTRMNSDLVRQMMVSWERHPQREKVASIHPRYVDPNTGIEAPVPRAGDGSPVFPMTSGSLMPVWIFDRIGSFAAEYFIDFVDFEYAFRIRRAGYLIADSKEAKLIHSPGHPKKTTILGRSFYSSHHNAIRRYYIARNSVHFCKGYFFSFPKWILRIMYRQFRETVSCLVAEENRRQKFRNVLLGIWDGLTGRMKNRDGL